MDSRTSCTQLAHCTYLGPLQVAGTTAGSTTASPASLPLSSAADGVGSLPVKHIQVARLLWLSANVHPSMRRGRIGETL